MFEQQFYFDDSSKLIFYFVMWEQIIRLSGLYCIMGHNLKHIYENQNALRTYSIWCSYNCSLWCQEIEKKKWYVH
jgi:hypothetical protein